MRVREALTPDLNPKDPNPNPIPKDPNPNPKDPNPNPKDPNSNPSPKDPNPNPNQARDLRYENTGGDFSPFERLSGLFTAGLKKKDDE